MRLILLLPALSIVLQQTVAQSPCPDVHFKTIPSATLSPTTTTQLSLVRQSDASYTSYERSISSPYTILSNTQHFEKQLLVCLPPAAPASNPAAAAPANPVGGSSQTLSVALLNSGNYLTVGTGIGGVPVALLDPQLNILSTSSALIVGTNNVLADVNGDGILDIVSIANGGEMTPGQLIILIGTGGVGFQAPITYPIGSSLAQLTSLTIGDFTGDHKPDVAVAMFPHTGEGEPGTISIFLGNGDGTFRTGPVLALPDSPVSVATADLNGDGKLDLAFTTIGPGNTSIAIALGNGDGTFAAPAYLPGAGGSIAIGDMNGDGFPDIVTLGTILFGNGKGSFPTRQDYVIPPDPSYEPYSVILTDFNGDGRLDVVMAWGTPAFITGAYGLPITVLFAQPDGTFFGPAISVPTPPPGVYYNFYNSDLRSADFNGDGIPDLAYADFTGIGVMLGNGDGTFSSSYVSGTSDSGSYLATGDFNGDGNQDIVALGSISSSKVGYSFFAGKGDGTFKPPIATPLQGSPAAIVAGDFNKDGKLDLAILFTIENSGTADQVTIYLGNGDGSFRQGATYPTGPTASWMLAGDLNNDGKLDLVVTNAGTENNSGMLTQIGNVTTFLGNGDGTFSVGTPIPIPVLNAEGYPGTMALADFNRDGKLDLALTVASYSTPPGASLAGFAVLLGNGDGTFLTPIVTSLPTYSLAAADVNGDGLLDLVTISQVNNVTPQGLYYLIGKGDGSFQPEISLNLETYEGLVVADFNRDGRPDVASAALPLGFFSALNLTSSPPAFNVISSASFAPGPVAPDSFVSAVGTGLPASLDNIAIAVTDVNGVSRAAQVLYASPIQINFLIPPGTAAGVATVTITSSGSPLVAQVEIVPIQPGLFTENYSGLAAAYAIRVDAQGNQTFETVFTSSNGVVTPTPISLGAPSDQVYLILFGTGFDSPGNTSVLVGNRSASVVFAGPQGSTPGLDQTNILLPHALAGSGNVAVVLTAGGIVANRVFVAIQ
jgi:uncharacterized protein (TIGR03437 family)